MRQDFKSLGDRLKAIESKNSSYLSPYLPVYARLDGKAFSKFTKGMNKPFDDTLHRMFIDTVTTLVDETNASIAYHQSDEISLYWEVGATDLFNGRIDKWIGELSGLATAKFNQLTMEYFPDKLYRLPRFDCRIMSVDDDTALKFFLWRQMDCIKNSVSVLAQQHFSHNQLLKINTKTKREWLSEKGVPWEDLNPEYKYGSFVRKQEKLLPVELSGIDPKYHHNVPDMVTRNVITKVVYSPLQNFDDLRDLLWYDECKRYIIT